MPKTRIQYVCPQCGRTAARPMGRCPQCGAHDFQGRNLLNATIKRLYQESARLDSFFEQQMADEFLPTEAEWDNY